MDISRLPKAARLASLGEHAPRWRPGLGRTQQGVRHSEIFASIDDASGAGCALALALDDLRHMATDRLEEKPLLWVQDELSCKRSGWPYRPGLPRELRHRLIHVAARKPEDALFALEEGMRCRDLACVIGEIVGNPRALDLTATRRLSLAAEKHGVSLFLIRHDARPDVSSARMRWNVRSAPSPQPRWNPAAPGQASWHAELFRARAHARGEWILRDDGKAFVAERPAATHATAPDHGDLAGVAGAGSLAAL
jgi:protein ImuA